MKSVVLCLASLACSLLWAASACADPNQVTVTGMNGPDGTPGYSATDSSISTPGGNGSVGENASAKVSYGGTGPAASFFKAIAVGGLGGSGGAGGSGSNSHGEDPVHPDGSSGGSGAAGGNADTGAVISGVIGDVNAVISAIGGAGGRGGHGGETTGVDRHSYSGLSGAGGDGGTAGGAASVFATGNVILNGAFTAGVGGDSVHSPDNGLNGYSGAGGRGGGIDSGTILLSGNSTGGGAVTVSAAAIGGGGGAYGDRGEIFLPYALSGSADLLNAVTGSTGGALTLTQSATGGQASFSNNVAPAAIGGSATSVLDQQLLAPAVLSGSTVATGGSGGYYTDGGAGGTATAVTALVGSGEVTSAASAVGGGQTQDPLINTADARASATSLGGGRALATAHSKGNADSASNVNASTFNTKAGPVRNVTTVGELGKPQTGLFDLINANLDALADALIDRPLPSRPAPPIANDQITLVAEAVGSPRPADVSAAIGTTNPRNFALLDNGKADVLTLATLGASASGREAAFFCSGVTLSVDPSQLPHGANTLAIGLLDPQVAGGGFGHLEFRLKVNGELVADVTFATVAEAVAYFHDRVLDLGKFPEGTDVKIGAKLKGDTVSGGGFNETLLVVNVPEPGTWSLLAIGGSGLLWAVRRRRHHT